MSGAEGKALSSLIAKANRTNASINANRASSRKWNSVLGAVSSHTTGPLHLDLIGKHRLDLSYSTR